MPTDFLHNHKDFGALLRIVAEEMKVAPVLDQLVRAPKGRLGCPVHGLVISQIHSGTQVTTQTDAIAERPFAFALDRTRTIDPFAKVAKHPKMLTEGVYTTRVIHLA